MRAGFLLAVLALAGGYTTLAFTELAWLSPAGRLAPGFFPRIIGVCLVALCLHSLYAERRSARPPEPEPADRGAAATMVALCAAFVVLLEVLGGPLAMVLFMVAALFRFNRGHPLQNALVALILPAAVYVLFRVWLNAAMPPGILPLPF